VRVYVRVCMCPCLSVCKTLSCVYVFVFMRVRCVFERVFGRASSYLCLCVCIDARVYVCMPVLLWEYDSMKHAEVRQSKVHVNRSRTRTNRGFGV